MGTGPSKVLDHKPVPMVHPTLQKCIRRKTMGKIYWVGWLDIACSMTAELCSEEEAIEKTKMI